MSGPATALCPLRRTGFAQILAEAVHASFAEDVYPDRDAWQTRVKGSDVRLQWDPDRDPHGAKQQRRAIQLDLRGAMLARFADEWIVEIRDLSAFVQEQHAQVHRPDLSALLTPREDAYPIADAEVAVRLGIGGW